MEKENKTLDLCEKLAGCPKGTKLWSPLFGECEFVALGEDMETSYPDECVVITCDEMGRTYFDKHGHYFDFSEECLLFQSKENLDWDSWVNPKPKVERFDPKTFKPFDMVLVRDLDKRPWKPTLLAYCNAEARYPFVTIGAAEAFTLAIPYNEDTKHLAGTKDEAPEYYRWWEDKA